MKYWIYKAEVLVLVKLVNNQEIPLYMWNGWKLEKVESGDGLT